MKLKEMLWKDNASPLLQGTTKFLQSGVDALSSLMDASARRTAQSMGDKSSAEGWEKLLQVRSTATSEDSHFEDVGPFEDGWRWGSEGYGYYQSGFRMPHPDDE